MRNSRAFAVLVFAAVVFGYDAGARADNAQTDQAVHGALRDVINHGADLFNINADHAGCYRVYEGALMTVKPLLGHHPDLVKAIDQGLAEAKEQPKVADRAFTLRKVLDVVRTKIKSTAIDPIPVAKESLWDKLRGKDKFPRLVDEYVADVVADPRIDFGRAGKLKFDLDKVKVDVFEYIGKKTDAGMTSRAVSFKDALDATHLEDFEFNLAVALFKEKLKKAGINTADANALVKALAITQKPLAVAPVPPVDRVVRTEQPKPEETLWERLRGKDRMPAVVDEFVASVAADPLIDFNRTGKKPIDAAKVKAAVLAFIGKKAGAGTNSTADSFKDALDANHLQDFEFSLAIAALKAKLKQAGVEDDDAYALLKVVDVTHQPITIIPVAPALRAEPNEKSPPEEKKTSDTKAGNENAFDPVLLPYAAAMAIGSRSLSQIPANELASVASSLRPRE